MKHTQDRLCPDCGYPIAIRNQAKVEGKGDCDHLYYPENKKNYISPYAKLRVSHDELLEACRNMLYWKKKADTTPELLLSSHHAKSGECSEIMCNYEDGFKRIEQAIAKVE